MTDINFINSIAKDGMRYSHGQNTVWSTCKSYGFQLNVRFQAISLHGAQYISLSLKVSVRAKILINDFW